jgi:hypothetical protein
MFDEPTLRLLGKWEPISSFGEADCQKAVTAFIAAIGQQPDLRAVVGDHTYNNYVPVYVYAPAEVTRHTQTDGQVRTTYPCLLFYFHHFAPIAALGRSSWGETLRPNGTWSSQAYGALDLSGLLSLAEVQPASMHDRISTALQRTPYSIGSPEYLRQSAPDGFGPLERSGGILPWDRLFHLFFQFND